VAIKVLAGPILRRCEAHSVSVWVALDAAALVRVRVYPLEPAPGWQGDGRPGVARPGPILLGAEPTIAVGTRLHIACATAVVTSAGASLQPDSLYCYDIELQAGTGPAWPFDENEGNLHACGLLADRPATHGLALGYVLGQLPRLVLPPSELRHLRIFHGSCRKAHAPGPDALVQVDNAIQATLDDPIARPHQLVLTGDQIYADDVSPALLRHLTTYGNSLLGWTERVTVPTLHWLGDERDPTEKPIDDPSLGTYLRQPIVNSEFRGSAGMSTEEGHCHLIGLAEFCAMYLLAWSEDAHPAALPDWHDLVPKGPWRDTTYPLGDWSFGVEPSWLEWDRNAVTGKLEQAYPAVRARTQKFLQSVPVVRRALANIPTYMMFDDHEITDDWYLDGAWLQSVWSSDLGRRIVSNGLMAYTVFQAWGNDPAAFSAPASKGRELLLAIQEWRGSGEPELLHMQRLFGVSMPWSPAPVLRNERVLFDFEVAWPRHRLVALDTRTWRKLVPGQSAELIDSGTPFKQMVSERLGARPAGIEITFVVSPPPVFGLTLLESVAQPLSASAHNVHISRRKRKGAYAADAEYFARSPAVFEQLLSVLQHGAPVVILSGDVHYGFSVRCDYWSDALPDGVVIAQLVSSSLKNSAGITFTLQKIAQQIESIEGWDNASFVGWKNPRRDLAIVASAGFLDSSVQLSRPKNDPVVESVRGRAGIALRSSRPPDWSYNVVLQSEWRRKVPDVYPELFPPLPPFPDTPLENTPLGKIQKLAYTAAAMKRHLPFLNMKGGGKVVVGLNNIAEIRIDTVPNMTVQQNLWCQVYSITEDGADPAVSKAALALTSHRLRLDRVSTPRPEILPL